jgi:hypothetical protein
MGEVLRASQYTFHVQFGRWYCCGGSTFVSRKVSRVNMCREKYICIHHCLCEHGNFTPCIAKTKIYNSWSKGGYYGCVNENPGISIRRVAMQVGVTHLTDWRVLREQQLNSYHLQHVQALSPQDYPVQVMLCQCFLQQRGINPNFVTFVILMEESQFTRDAIQKCHNQHLWTNENPHAILTLSPPVVLHQHLGQYLWW